MFYRFRRANPNTINIMRKLVYISLLWAILTSCDKNDLITYQEGSGIFFDNRAMLLDSVEVPWGLKNSEVTEQNIRFEVKLFGAVKDYDRPFNIKIEDNPADPNQAKVNVDYKPFPLTYVIPKGQASAFIDITILRNSELLTLPKNLAIDLQETDELKFLYSRKFTNQENVTRQLDVRRVVKINENFPIPRWWPIYGTGYFGKWSVKKSILICEMMDIDREKWVGNVLLDEDFNEGILKFAGVYVHRWLQQQNPLVLDEDGKAMEMGTLSKR